MRMFVLDNGIISMPEVNIYTGGSNDKWIDIPIHTFLIDHPEGWVLFDAACDPDGMTKNWPKEFTACPYVVPEGGYLPQRLAQLGVEPQEIRHVVVSHLHIDHAGCLKDFTNAVVHVNNEEFKRTLRQYVIGEGLGAHMKSDIESWLLAELNWHPISCEETEIELFDGLKIINFGPGHSWGMLGLLIELKKDGNYLLVSDAIYSQRHIDPPGIKPGIVEDEEGYRNTVDFILRYAKAKNARVLYGHDLEQFKGLVTSTQGFYE